ncbi:glutamic acid-rich protein-like isoform X2 [Macrobrachium rosenbergii]
MLFNDKWDNLYVEGLKRTLDYLTEAVKNLFLVGGLQCVRVLLITISPELAKLYVDCIRELAKCCNQNVSYSAGDTIEKGTTVLITTLDAMHKLVRLSNPRQSKFNKPHQYGNLNTTRLKALILDDGPALFQNCPRFIKSYLSKLAGKGVNVVITAAKISNKEFKDVQGKIHPIGGFKKIFVESLKKKDSKPLSSAKSSSYRSDVLERMIASTRPSDTKPVPRKTSESQISKDKTDKASEDKSSSKEKTSTTRSSSRGSSSRSSSSKDSSSSSQKLDERVKTLAALEIRYKKTLAEMDKEQKRELELYISSPEFHPEFEQKYSIFMEQYKAKYPRRNDIEHSNKLWEELWRDLITLLLKEEYDAKKQDLEKEYKDKKEKAFKPKAIPSQDSREKENKQDSAKQERRSSESQKRKSSTDNRDNDRVKYRRDERSSDVGRRRMNQNKDEDGLRGRTHQRNRNEDSDKGRRQQYNRNEECSRDSFGRGHQYLDHEEKSSRDGGMQQNSNKEEFNKGKMQKSSFPVDDTESSTDMRETINLLQELCPSLGVLGPAAQLLMRKISVCLSDGQELSELVQNEDNKMILMRLLEKAEAMKIRLSTNHALQLLNIASLPAENPKYYGLNIENIAKMTYNMDPAFIVQCIKNALTAQDVYNASEKDVSDIYIAVTSAHFGIACSKSGEAAQPKTQVSRQGDSGSLKRRSPGWDDDDRGSRPKRVEGSWSGRDLGVNSSSVTQGRQLGGRNELESNSSGKQFGRGDVNLWNAKTNDTVDSSQKGNFGHQKAQDFGQQQVTDCGHKSTNSISIGMNMNSSNSSRI